MVSYVACKPHRLQGVNLFLPAEALQPTPRKWYDRLADTILGEDETASTPGAGAASKYALICKRCFTHNGLVREKEFETTRKRF